MGDVKDMKFGTKAIHAGVEPDPTTGAIMTPIYQTSTYVQAAVGVHKGYEYSRTGNPTRNALENAIAQLENGKYGACFGSGMAAIDCLCKMLKPGDEVISTNDLYGGTYRIFTTIFEQYGIKFHFVPMGDAESVKAMVNENTKLIWAETPTNPMMNIIDIKALATVAKGCGAMLGVDNTFATPCLQTPLDLGADIVMHSATKYIGGHSDVIAGAVLGGQEVMSRVKVLRTFLGNMAGPWTGWLLMRSLETLKVRMEAQQQGAIKVAEFLNNHPKVKKVYYLGLIPEGTKEFEIYKRQYSGSGAMLSFDIEGGEKEAFEFINSLKLIKLAVSLGSTESLVEHPKTMTHAGVSVEDLAAANIGDSLVRISVGIEDAKDLIWDIEQALS